MFKRWIVPGVAFALMIVSLALYAFLKSPVEASAPIEVLASEEPAAVDAATLVFEISQAESQVRYLVEEVLVGKPNTVVGATNQVAGQIAVNPDDPTQTTVGVLTINARTFATDDAMRDRAVQQRILRSDRWETITFQPTAYLGLPPRADVGKPYTFQIIGDLTIRGETHPTTWDVTVSGHLPRAAGGQRHHHDSLR